ncbi:MAG: type 4a pilus biogenesis protein PilO [Deltaproteobacteria bacterium]|jgi:type IV pilus assembly protein PilO|nr:type 4a pilus biogenesis protein PilO [Deltaproteobacteria bacterium]
MEISAETQEKLDKILKLPKGARIGILVGIGVLLCTGYYFGSYQGDAQELARLQAEEANLQRKLSEVRLIAGNIVEFEAEIAALEIKLKKALRQLPNEKQLEVLLTDISNLGKTAGVEIRSFQRQQEIFHDFYAEVPIAIQIDGQYHDIGKFFELLSQLKRIVNMGSLKIGVESESVEATRLKVTGTATTFRFVGAGSGA